MTRMRTCVKLNQVLLVCRLNAYILYVKIKCNNYTEYTQNEEVSELVDTEEQVREIMSAARSTEEMAEMITDPRKLDLEEEDAVTNLMTTGCGCHQGEKSQACFLQFSREHVLSVRAACAELTHSELDLAIMGQLMAFMMQRR